jgi:hypothetical protein
MAIFFLRRLTEFIAGGGTGRLDAGDVFWASILATLWL